jgi:hypothetical protein
MTIAVKYNEEVCFVNEKGRRFFFDADFAPAVQIPVKTLVDYQLHFLKMIDHNLFVSEEEYFKYVDKIMKMAAVIKEDQK